MQTIFKYWNLLLDLDGVSASLRAPMKYDDLSTQSSDKHMFNCFSGSGPHGEAESTGTAQPGEEKLRRDFINVYKYLMEEIK